MSLGASACDSKTTPRQSLPAAAARILLAALRYFLTTDIAALHDRGTHRTYLIVCLVIVGGAFLIAPGGSSERLTLFGASLPPTCPSHALFDVQCPGCGMTRSFVCAAHGQFRESLRQHRMGLLLYAFFAWQIVFRVYCLRRLPEEPNRFLLWLQRVAPPVLISLLILNWLIGFALGGNGS